MFVARARSGNLHREVLIAPPDPPLLACRRKTPHRDARRDTRFALPAARTVHVLAAAAEADVHQLAVERGGHGQTRVAELRHGHFTRQVAAHMRSTRIQRHGEGGERVMHTHDGARAWSYSTARRAPAAHRPRASPR